VFIGDSVVHFDSFGLYYVFHCFYAFFFFLYVTHWVICYNKNMQWPLC